MSKNKKLEIPSEDIKETDNQEEVPVDEDEEEVDDIDESEEESTPDESEDDDDSGEEGTDDDDGAKKPFKNRKERAEFFKKKNKDKSDKDSDKDVLTKSDFYKMNERKAIDNLTEVSESDSDEDREFKGFVTKRWNDIVPHINLRNVDKSNAKSYEQAIKRAILIVKSEDPEDEDATDVDARKKIMSDSRVKGKTGKGTPQKKKSILGSTDKGMDHWYSKDED